MDLFFHGEGWWRVLEDHASSFADVGDVAHNRFVSARRSSRRYDSDRGHIEHVAPLVGREVLIADEAGASARVVYPLSINLASM